MPRIPLATDLKTRTGAPDKDARIKNAYVETRGGQSVVRKRPIAQGGISVATVGSIAQGGIGFTTYSGGSSSSGLFFLSGDTQSTYTGDGTTWSAGTNYVTGDHVTQNWKDYWAIDNNIGNSPSSSPTHWSTTYIPPIPAPPATYAIWNSLDKTSNAFLSNGNKTVLLSAAAGPVAGVRSNIGKSSDKWYWELTIASGTYDALSDNFFAAVATLADPINYALGDFPNGWSYVIGANVFTTPCPCKYNNTTPVSYGASYTIGDVVGCALDMNAGTIKFYKNGIDQGIAYSGLTGTIYAGVSFGSGGSRNITIIANFGASAFAYSVPSGYNSGLYV